VVFENRKIKGLADLIAGNALDICGIRTVEDREDEKNP